MWPVSEFEVQVWRGGREPPCCYVTRSAADIAAELATPTRPFFMEVDAVEQRKTGDICWGEIHVWLNADGMAWVQLNEHRGHQPSDPSRRGLTGEVGGFFDETEGPFAVPAANVITEGQAARVLAHWLDCGG
jgi:hypothetical protein